MKKRKEENGDEALNKYLEAFFDVYENYKKVMQTGQPHEKEYARRTFREMINRVRQDSSEMANKSGIDFRTIEEIIEKDPSDLAAQMRHLKTKIGEIQKTLKEEEPKPKEKSERIKGRIRKSHIEKKLRMKGL